MKRTGVVKSSEWILVIASARASFCPFVRGATCSTSYMGIVHGWPRVN